MKNAVSLLCCVDQYQTDASSISRASIDEVLTSLMPACESNRERYREIVDMVNSLGRTTEPPITPAL
jgi:hypothetical protein